MQATRARRPPRLADEVASLLRAAIRGGRYQPGQRLLHEQVAAELGVSRTPLREALQMLGQEGLVTFLPNGAVRVFQPDRQAVRDLFEFREMVDGLAARLAAERATPEGCRLLLDAHAALADDIAAGRRDRWFDGNLAFHRALLLASENSRLIALESMTASAQILLPFVVGTGSRPADTVQEHASICAAIGRGDPAAAERAARDHIIHAREAVLRYLDQPRPPAP